MRPSRMFVTCVALCSTMSIAYAQTDSDRPTVGQVAVACSPPAQIQDPPAGALRILGTQDTFPRMMYATGDLLVIPAGSESGLQLGQRFYVRRPVYFGGARIKRARNTLTAGWVRIVSMNEKMALASIEHLCDAILENDYLVPFTMPQEPASVSAEPIGDLDFSAIGHVVGGAMNRDIGANGDVMLVDRGTEQGVTPGARFAIYRDIHADSMPLASIGEAVVLTTAPASSLVRITRTRDAVRAGDFLVPQK